MKYKWPVTAIKPLKNKLFSVTSNPSTLVYFMSSMIIKLGLIKLDSKNTFLFPCLQYIISRERI